MNGRLSEEIRSFKIRVKVVGWPPGSAAIPQEGKGGGKVFDSRRLYDDSTASLGLFSLSLSHC